MISSINLSGTRKTRLLTVLDIGSSKIACIIARLRPHNRTQYLPRRTYRMEVLGFGIQQSRGVKSGVIVDLGMAEQAVRFAVDAAERMAGLVVYSVIVNFSSRGMKSNHVTAKVPVSGHTVTMRDIRHVLSEGSHVAFHYDRPIIHSLPVSFNLDGEQNMDDPRDMIGSTLGVDMHIVTTDSAPLRNLERCINRAHLSVERIVATPFASGLSILVDDEAQLGAICVDVGGGMTSISVFSKGKFIFADSLALGGNHITLDIAHGFSISIEEAERLKVMHGSILSCGRLDNEYVIVLPPLRDTGADASQYPQGMLSRIIQARVEEILELVRDRLNRSNFGNVIGKRLILTGGTSQLTGLPEVARHILSCKLRVGRPLGISGLPDMARGAAFSTAVGLLIYPQAADFDDQKLRFTSAERPEAVKGRFQRVGRWLRESF
ncbi:MAG: cell division protein FtsA [Candidatus Tokpelaia sp. JSC188]|nr:MAG: cell division protein FtsA [Candidatus Tokpelaia sp. JSC188]